VPSPQHGDEPSHRGGTDGRSYDFVAVVGGGIRKPEPLLEFFEAVINLIRVHAPSAAIAFNTDGGTSLEAAQRVLTRSR
jgi:hypothetical protein